MRSIFAIAVLSGLSGLAIATPIEAPSGICWAACFSTAPQCPDGWDAEQKVGLVLDLLHDQVNQLLCVRAAAEESQLELEVYTINKGTLLGYKLG
ncbi:hypothetical protein MY8738_001423 [Beauveria namnaoensis]